MKTLCLSVFIFCFITVYSQDKSNWNQLIESAHDIGYCLYNINQPFCDLHLAALNRLKSDAPEDEPEIHYFVMKEEWAKNRVTKWAERVTKWENDTKLKKNNLVLFFDVNQHYIHFNSLRQVKGDSSFFGHSSFFVLNLEDDLKFKINKSFKNLALNCSVYHNSEPNILFNIMWREFMSGRYGLLENKIEFGIASNSKIRKKFRIFKRQFKRFKKVILK